MPIGIIANVTSVVLGSFAGCIVGSGLNEDIKQKMNWICGLCAFGMGISAIMLMKNMPPVVFSIMAGTLIGLFLKLGQAIQNGTEKVLSVVVKDADQAQKDLLLTAVILFCASGTGIYGSMDAGMTGNHSVLIAKSVLDFFTAMIFAAQLGKVTAFIGIPQFLVMMVLFLSAKAIVPLTTDAMICDFKACGGFILIATGFRILQLRAFPIADMLPAMVLVMPVSWAWTNWILPLIG